MNFLQRISYKLFGRYLREGEYVRQITSKNNLNFHFTAGYGDAKSVGDYFDQTPGMVATTYSCGRDGVICELFPPAYWAYHLGSSLFNEMRSISIEIVNIGPLWLRNGIFYDAYNNVYRGEVLSLKTPYKGVYHWAEFTPEQYEAVGRWAAERCISFNIKPVINRSLEFDPKNEKLIGITTHSQFRLDKYDIGPAWNWDLFEQHFKAEYLRLSGVKL